MCLCVCVMSCTDNVFCIEMVERCYNAHCDVYGGSGCCHYNYDGGDGDSGDDGGCDDRSSSYCSGDGFSEHIRSLYLDQF